MFGEDSVPKIFKGEKLYVTVNDKRADIDLSNLVCVIYSFNVLCVIGYLFRMSNVRMMRLFSKLSRLL